MNKTCLSPASQKYIQRNESITGAGAMKCGKAGCPAPNWPTMITGAVMPNPRAEIHKLSMGFARCL